MGRLSGTVASLFVAIAVAACTAIQAPRVAVGTPSAEVRSRLGAPTDERRLASGGSAWDYVFGPFGFDTWRYEFDEGGRVARARQLLTFERFRQMQPGMTRAEVAELIGRPMETMSFGRSNTEVWTYRWRDGSIDMLNDVTFAADTGRLLYYALYMDPRVTNSVDR